jgi:uncharacterized protein Usg
MVITFGCAREILFRRPDRTSLLSISVWRKPQLQLQFAELFLIIN